MKMWLNESEYFFSGSAKDQKEGRRDWREFTIGELSSLYYPLLGISYAFVGAPVLLISDATMSQLMINSRFLQPFKEHWLVIISCFTVDIVCCSIWLVHYFFLLTIYSLVCNKLDQEMTDLLNSLRYFRDLQSLLLSLS